MEGLGPLLRGDMKIIYAKNSSKIEEEGSFRNPEYFERAQAEATSVIIYGDYPQIEKAYEDLKVKVEVRDLSKQTLVGKKANGESKKNKQHKQGEQVAQE